MSQINSNPRAVVIGGGATGCGVARDLALRGFDVTLAEFGDLGSGTSSRFHGMLQCGARYAVSDTEYAAECMRERLIVARLAPEVVEQTGGLFVSLPDDPPEFADLFVAGCQNANIPVKELDPDRVMVEEPAIARNVLRAFSVPDATVQSWRLVNLLADDVRRRGGKILTRHRVTEIGVRNGRVRGVRVVGSSGEQTLEADVVVNAAGPWSARVADMVGESVRLELGKGSIIVLSYRMVSRAVNRCRPPGSHDIIVPTGTVSLFGTTSEVVDDPDTTYVRPEEIQELLNNAEALLPDVRRYRVFRAWAGVRPLYKPMGWLSENSLPRRHAVIDHENNGVAGFFTVCGGSLTTHRSMAEDLGNHVCRSLGLNTPSTTATIPLSESANDTGWSPVDNYRCVEKDGRYLTLVCECESVERSDVVDLIENRDIKRLHDIRRRLRVGFGPCQGTFCGSRVAALIARHHPNYPTNEDLGRFWVERLKGVVHTAWGQQARQALLSDAVYRETLGVRLKPELMLPEDHR
jgi:glycerol-3-phosphate dehydrogenase